MASGIDPYGVRYLSVMESSGCLAPASARGETDPVLSDRRVRATLRRLAAGEQRKRACRIADALRDGSFCTRYVPRLRLRPEEPELSDPEYAEQGDRIEVAELWVGLPNRRRGMVAAAPLLRNLDRKALREDMLRFTLSAAVAEVATWPESWRVAVPVPGRTMADGAVCDMALELLADMEIAPSRLDVQIDESELVEAGTLLHQRIAALREAGIGVVLEGFGAAFGSLALLPRLPLTGLKLDRRLVHAVIADNQADDITLIRAAVEIAHRVGVAVTVDGIETKAEMQRSRSLGVDLAQGPWIGPPSPAEAMRARGRRAS